MVKRLYQVEGYGTMSRSAAERAEKVRQTQSRIAADRALNPKPKPTAEQNMYPTMQKQLKTESRTQSYQRTTAVNDAELSDGEKWSELRKEGWQPLTEQAIRTAKAYPSVDQHMIQTKAFDGTPIYRRLSEAERSALDAEEARANE